MSQSTNLLSRKSRAVMPMFARAAIVGVNFGVMMLLAATLGFDAFGKLAVFWGIALVIAPVVSFGGPLLLLRALTDGGGVSARGILLHIVTLPAAMALAGMIIFAVIWPALPWELILLNAFCINVLTCIASVMRALGSVNISMALRDCGPQVSLGLAVLIAGPVLLAAAFWMACFAVAAGAWVLRHSHRRNIINQCHPTPRVSPSLWGTSVLGVGLSQVDIIVGGALLSPTQIGLYVVLRRVANLVALPVSVATWVSANAVSETHARGDLHGLQAASLMGSRVALVPGLLLFLLGLSALPFLASDACGIFTLLLSGAALQVVFASGFTVATLGGMAQFAALSRGVSIGIYLAFAVLVTGPVSNAVAYVGAVSLGSAALWAAIWHRTTVDTSAFALRKVAEGVWKTS
jgi:O-antigen/teichoic acid export membrane protein